MTSMYGYIFGIVGLVLLLCLVFMMCPRFEKNFREWRRRRKSRKQLRLWNSTANIPRLQLTSEHICRRNLDEYQTAELYYIRNSRMTEPSNYEIATSVIHTSGINPEYHMTEACIHGFNINLPHIGRTSSGLQTGDTCSAEISRDLPPPYYPDLQSHSPGNEQASNIFQIPTDGFDRGHTDWPPPYSSRRVSYDITSMANQQNVFEMQSHSPENEQTSNIFQIATDGFDRRNTDWPPPYSSRRRIYDISSRANRQNLFGNYDMQSHSPENEQTSNIFQIPTDGFDRRRTDLPPPYSSRRRIYDISSMANQQNMFDSQHQSVLNMSTDGVFQTTPTSRDGIVQPPPYNSLQFSNDNNQQPNSH